MLGKAPMAEKVMAGGSTARVEKGAGRKGRPYLHYIAALLLFGSNGIVASMITLRSYEIVFLRTGLGAAFLALVFLGTRQKLAIRGSGRHGVYLLVSGVAMGGSWILLFEAYTQVGVGIATLAYSCGPVIVMALSPLLFRERLTGAKGIGLGVVLLGIGLLNQGALSAGQPSRGLIYGLLAAILYAVMVIFSKKAVGITGLEHAMWQLIAGFLIVAVYILFSKEASFALTGGDILPVLLLGLLNTGLGCYLYFSSIQKLTAGSVALCSYLEPLSAVALSVLILKEPLAFLQMVGGVLMLGGAVLGDLWKRPRPGTFKSAGPVVTGFVESENL